MTRDQTVELLRAQQPHLVREYGVRRIGLFGSFAKDTASEASDIDLVMEFDRPIGLRIVELCDYLERLLGRRVDILTPIGLQTIRRPSIAQGIAETIVYVEARGRGARQRHPRGHTADPGLCRRHLVRGVS